MQLSELENHLLIIQELADNLFILSRGMADISPESEGAVRIISSVLRREAEESMDLLYKKQ